MNEAIEAQIKSVIRSLVKNKSAFTIEGGRFEPTGKSLIRIAVNNNVITYEGDYEEFTDDDINKILGYVGKVTKSKEKLVIGHASDMSRGVTIAFRQEVNENVF